MEHVLDLTIHKQGATKLSTLSPAFASSSISSPRKTRTNKNKKLSFENILHLQGFIFLKFFTLGIRIGNFSLPKTVDGHRFSTYRGFLSIIYHKSIIFKVIGFPYLYVNMLWLITIFCRRCPGFYTCCSFGQTSCLHWMHEIG